MRVYTRTTRREIRIIGSNDGSRGTGAGKSQRLSLLVAHPPLFFCRNVNPTRQKQPGVHRRRSRDPCFRRPRTHSLRAALPFFVPSSVRLLRLLHFQDAILGKKRSTTKKCTSGESSLLAAGCHASIVSPLARTPFAALLFPSAGCYEETNLRRESIKAILSTRRFNWLY